MKNEFNPFVKFSLFMSMRHITLILFGCKLSRYISKVFQKCVSFRRVLEQILDNTASS